MNGLDYRRKLFGDYWLWIFLHKPEFTWFLIPTICVGSDDWRWEWCLSFRWLQHELVIQAWKQWQKRTEPPI